jgi:CubicO group peptidase (beta-lactamase class C family)
VEDLYRWDQALYTDKLIPKNLRDQMFTPFGDFGYGYGWGIGKDGDHPVASHVGGVQGFSSFIARYPNDKVVIIVLGNREDVNSGAIGVQLAKMVFGEK